jgi:hypothetical protein
MLTCCHVSFQVSFIMWHICSKQKLSSQRNGCITRNNGVTVGSCLSCAVRAEAIQRRPAAITGQSSVTRVEVGSNTSTVTLRVVDGDEKGSFKSETVKSGRECQGTRTRESLRWQGPA